LRKVLKGNRQSKNEYFATKITTQKQIDMLSAREKIIEVQKKSIDAFIDEVNRTITATETKIKEELAVKNVIAAQKKAFKAQQQLVDAEQELQSTKVIQEAEKAEKTAAAKECKKEVDKMTAEVKSATEQLKGVTKALDTTKGTDQKEILTK
jgi:hypothetical protein